jgi:hypothetical protein
MASFALDLATVLKALQAYEQQFKVQMWHPSQQSQARVIELATKYKAQLSRVSGAKVSVADNHQDLNRFLAAEDFGSQLQPFSNLKETGLISSLQKKIEWRCGPAPKVDITTRTGTKSGFELPAEEVRVYRLANYPNALLAEIATTSTDTLWLFTSKGNQLAQDGWGVGQLALDVMASERRQAIKTAVFAENAVDEFGEIQVPMFSFNSRIELDWLVGLSSATTSTPRMITQAQQQFGLELGSVGPKAKGGTAMVVTKGLTDRPSRLVFNQPFYGWLTQYGVDFPLGAFFIDWDGMRPAR